MGDLRVFGVRHHGPASARGLLAALEAWAPDLLLVEGPPEAEAVLPFVADPGMKPPVALLITAVDDPGRAAFYPFAEWSPEWVALRWAAGVGVSTRFIDLPQAIRLARTEEESVEANDQEMGPDPLLLLAEASGLPDPDAWWDRTFEQRVDLAEQMEAVGELFRGLRPDVTPRDPQEARREAHMRLAIRAARREGFERVAVVCGAWHQPALEAEIPKSQDEAVLRGLKKVKVEAAWVPWTHSRLGMASGYGAGVRAPGWYRHLWQGGDSTRWIARAAHLLRAEGLDASPASVIEAVRLAEALAALRGSPRPRLEDTLEAVQAVLCGGASEPLALIHQRLVVDELLGEVPEGAPMVPLARDLAARQKSLRMKVSPEAEDLKLDLRERSHLEKSQLLHRLRLLGVAWGEEINVGGALGTFWEGWRLRWQPDLSAAVVEAAVWGNTVEVAASAKAAHDAEKLLAMPELSALLDRAILAGLESAVARVLERLRDVGAVATDMAHLADSLPPLARAARYSDVRKTPTERILTVFEATLERVLVGLPNACVGLDEEASAAMVGRLERVHGAVALLDRAGLMGGWMEALERLAHADGLDGGVRGKACRILLEAGRLPREELERLAGLALSPAVEPREAAAWLEGLVQGNGTVLLHEDGLWLALDAWIRALEGEVFVEMLPLLRRAFSGFSANERRVMGGRAKSLGAGGAAIPPAAELPRRDAERAARVVPVLRQILGVGG